MQTMSSSNQIFVQMLPGNTITLDVNPSDTAVAVKAYLHDRTGFSTQSLRLIFAGKQLRDSCTLEQHGIGWGSTLQLSGALCGGVRLFHCTSESNAASIMRNGFHCGSSGIVGGGIYFAMSAQDAIRQAHAKGTVLACDVELGRVHDVGFDGDRTLNLSRIRQLGCDSVRIPRNGEPGTEYCVYEPARVRLVGEHGSPNIRSHQAGANADDQAYDDYHGVGSWDQLSPFGQRKFACARRKFEAGERSLSCHRCNEHILQLRCPRPFLLEVQWTMSRGPRFRQTQANAGGSAVPKSVNLKRLPLISACDCGR